MLHHDDLRSKYWKSPNKYFVMLVSFFCWVCVTFSWSLSFVVIVLQERLCQVLSCPQQRQIPKFDENMKPDSKMTPRTIKNDKTHNKKFRGSSRTTRKSQEHDTNYKNKTNNYRKLRPGPSAPQVREHGSSISSCLSRFVIFLSLSVPPANLFHDGE